MRGIVASVLLLFSVSVFAAEGTTFCPQPGSFKFNKSSGLLEAPGGWNVPGDAKSKVVKFKNVQADYDGQIYFCLYDMKYSGQAMEIPAQANYYYVADEINGLKWRKGSTFKVCESTNPGDCPFHIEN